MQTPIKETFTGIGQIFLQENGLTGLVITIAMFFSHWTLGVACFLGSLIGTLTARGLNYPISQIQQGLYGFNGSLAFMCVMFTFGEQDASHPLLWLWGVAAAVVSTLLMRAFLAQRKIAFTFPFVLTCWFFCFLTAKFQLFGLEQTTPELSDYTDTFNAIQSPLYAWAEVNFGSSVITGGLLFVAIAISSPMAAMYGMAAAVLGTAFAHHLLAVGHNNLANGLYGFSPILVACAFAGNRLRDFLYILFGTLLAVLIQFGFSELGIASYTIGFILASWILLWVKSKTEAVDVDKEKWLKWLNP
nr:urea transporter [uncultured Haemophilus sp.]